MKDSSLSHSTTRSSLPSSISVLHSIFHSVVLFWPFVYYNVSLLVTSDLARYVNIASASSLSVAVANSISFLQFKLTVLVILTAVAATIVNTRRHAPGMLTLMASYALPLLVFQSSFMIWLLLVATYVMFNLSENRKRLEPTHRGSNYVPQVKGTAATSLVIVTGLVSSRVLPQWAAILCGLALSIIVYEREMFFWKQSLINPYKNYILQNSDASVHKIHRSSTVVSQSVEERYDRERPSPSHISTVSHTLPSHILMSPSHSSASNSPTGLDKFGELKDDDHSKRSVSSHTLSHDATGEYFQHAQPITPSRHISAAPSPQHSHHDLALSQTPRHHSVASSHRSERTHRWPPRARSGRRRETSADAERFRQRGLEVSRKVQAIFPHAEDEEPAYNGVWQYLKHKGVTSTDTRFVGWVIQAVVLINVLDLIYHALARSMGLSFVPMAYRINALYTRALYLAGFTVILGSFIQGYTVKYEISFAIAVLIAVSYGMVTV